jgi:hypothetical protein
MKKNIITLLQMALWSFCFIGFASIAKTPDKMFEISDEELKKLNIPEKEAQELKQFLTQLETSLTPEQKQEYVEEQRKLEAEMRSKGLDPNKPDDWVKLINEQIGAPPEVKPQPVQPQRAAEFAPRFEEPKPRIEKPLTSIASPETTRALINDLSRYLASFRQKALSRPALDAKLNRVRQELNELNYYLQVLRNPELATLLSTKDFSRLHKNLEQLYKSFASYEPEIVARRKPAFINEDDPYEVLDISYSASREEIAARYKELEASKSPAAIEKQLKAQKCTGAVCKKMVKQARRTFALIKEAYTLLKDPKKKKTVDAELRDKIDRESQEEKVSARAFDRVLSTVESSIYGQGLLRDIFSLIEKYKPQELEQMKTQMELEKRAYERSKQKVIIPQLPPRYMGYEPGPYEGFYQKMAQESYMKPQYPTRPEMGAGAGNHGAAQPGASAGGGTPAGEGSKGGKKEEKKDDKKDGKGEKSESSKPGKGKDVNIRSQDFEKFAALNDVEGLLKNAAEKKNKIQVTGKAAEGEEPKKEERSLDQILTDVDNELVQEGDIQPQAPVQLKQFFDEYGIEKLGKSLLDLKKTVSKLGPKDAELKKGFAQLWESKVAKNKNIVNEWRKKIATQIEPIYRAATNPRKIINAKKMRKYNLDSPTKNPYEKPAPGAPKEKGPEAGATDLGHLRNVIETVDKTFNELAQTLSAKVPEPAPAEKKPEEGEKSEK